MAYNRPEILAPAGSFASLEAAVRSGADAVYLGATQFSARRGAENFDAAALNDAAAYCRIRGVKCYLTLNILLRPEELEPAFNVVRTAVNAGIDGVIVQDLGLAQLLHGRFPELALHASTQTSVHTPSALPLLKQLGFTRVVAAREMNEAGLASLCRAARELHMTVEVFVHGALCMSVSGQCLLSAVLGGRSGNRGLCAGPCRLPFSVPGGTGFDLSLKDLSLLKHLDALAEMGVASLKIEGRMKRPEYVAAATAACRAVLDTGSLPETLDSALNGVFSRSGFTDGYFTGNLGRDMFGVRTEEDAAAANTVYPALHDLYRTERQSVPITAAVTLAAGLPARLSLSDGMYTVSVSGDRPQIAERSALSSRSVTEAIEKLGGTPYTLTHIDATIQDGLFLRASELNALRREAVKALNTARAAVIPLKEYDFPGTIPDRVRPNRPVLIARFAEAGQISKDCSGLAAIMLPIECEPPADPAVSVPLIVDLPRGILDKEMLLRLLEKRRSQGYRAACCGNLAAVRLAQRAGLPVIGGIGLNILNERSAAVLTELGAAAVTLSPELRLSAAAALPTPIPAGIFAYGRLPLMLTRNCPAANGRGCTACDRRPVLTDRMNTSFPVRCRAGFSEVFNSRPIYLADRIDDTAGLDFLLLFFTDETQETAARIINAYRYGGKTPPVDFTRGLYYKTEP